MKRYNIWGITAVALTMMGAIAGGGDEKAAPNTATWTKNWVSSSFVGKPSEYYVITKNKDTQVGNIFYDFQADSMSQGPGGWSSSDVNAMQLYALPGANVSKSVAVKMKNGDFFEADAVGTSTPQAKPANPISVPNTSDVISITVWSTGLPSSRHATFTTETGEPTIERILTWLKNANEVGVEPPTLGKGGYPPGLSIATKQGTRIFIGPAIDWTVKKYPNVTTISGRNVVGYVALGTTNSSKIVRLYAPELYNWLMNREWG